MSDAPSVIFGIPLMARSVAPDWSGIVRHFNATLGSIYRQTDPAFRVIVACTDRPEVRIQTDERLEFIECEQQAADDYHGLNRDAGSKRHAIAERLRRVGGGYLMFTDADDLISEKLVEFVRRSDHPDGYLVSRGYLFDTHRKLLAPFPLSGDSQTFDMICGTSTIVRFNADELPGAADWGRYRRLMSRGHHHVRHAADSEKRPLMDLPFPAVVYVKNTGSNNSTRRIAGNDVNSRDWHANQVERAAAQAVEQTAALLKEFNLAALTAEPGAGDDIRSDIGVRFSVVISTFRRPDGLRRLLAALRPQVQGRRDREVIVVNDGSHNAAYQAVAAEFASLISYNPLATNMGIAQARNRSAKLARGEYLVFVDDDCEPPPYWLDWLQARLQLHAEIDIVAGTTLPLWGERQSLLARMEAHYGFLPHPRRRGGDVLFVTANLAVRRELFKELGGFGFASYFPGAGEDTELSARATRMGARICVDPEWFVRHEVGRGLISQMRRNWRYGYANTYMTCLTTAPRAFAGLRQSARRLHPRRALGYWRMLRPKANTFQGHALARVASLAGAIALHLAYYDGCATAAKRLKRAVPVTEGKS